MNIFSLGFIIGIMNLQNENHVRVNLSVFQEIKKLTHKYLAPVFWAPNPLDFHDVVKNN